MADNSEKKSYNGFVHVKTEKAILFSLDNVKENAKWYPLSQLVYDEDNIDAGDETEVMIPKWLADKHGLSW